MVKKFKDVEFNIFQKEDGKFEGLIFDQYRRVRFKTYLKDTYEEALAESHRIIKSYRKGFCTSSCGGIHIDEGKPIRDKIIQAEKDALQKIKDEKKVNNTLT
jgi:hypothetical protein